MSNWGMKISLPGYDVFDALPHQCSVHSAYPCLKFWSGYRDANFTSPAGFYLYGTINIVFSNNPPAGTPTEVFRIEHDLGAYTPACLVRGTHHSVSAGALQGTFPIEPTGTLKIYATTDQDYFKIMVRRDAGWGTMVGDTLSFSFMIFGSEGA